MSIDEAIAHAKLVAKKNREICRLKTRENAPSIFKCAEEHEQLAEWLEELKAIKSNGRYVQGNKAGQKIGYRSAIDDFIHECDKRCGFYTVGNKILTREDILLIAKQLKAGGDSGTDNQ